MSEGKIRCTEPDKSGKWEREQATTLAALRKKAEEREQGQRAARELEALLRSLQQESFKALERASWDLERALIAVGEAVAQVIDTVKWSIENLLESWRAS